MNLYSIVKVKTQIANAFRAENFIKTTELNQLRKPKEKKSEEIIPFQLTFTCSKSAIKTLEKCVKYV